MHKFVAFNNLIDLTEIPFQREAVQNIRHIVLTPFYFRPNIQQTLARINFKYHRTSSYSNIIRECNAGVDDTLLMFWRLDLCESRQTVSMSASSCSSLPFSNQPPAMLQPANLRERDLRSTAQQTEISCRHSSNNSSPVTYGVDSLPFSSPASPILQSAERSMSILGSVCALLMNKQGTPAAKEVPSFTESICTDNICRICFGGESTERLVRPCSCRGTIAAVHRSCLERWLLQASTSYCELCRHHYVVTRSHKWSWMRSVLEWARSGRGRALAADAWRGAALCAASVLGTARALHACDRVLQAGARVGGTAALAANLFSSLLIGIIGALNGLLTTWMLLKIQEHQTSWQQWRDSTLHLHVTIAGEELSPSSRASDATIVADADGNVTVDRSTNIADPFMVALPFTLPDS